MKPAECGCSALLIKCLLWFSSYMALKVKINSKFVQGSKYKVASISFKMVSKCLSGLSESEKE